MVKLAAISPFGASAVKNSTANISTLVAVGGTLISLPAAALELGEVQVRSHLGQPLRASVAFALAPTEALSNTCVSVQSGKLPGGMPGVGDATVSVANGVISITGKTPVREPLISVRLNVHCPYAAQISRDYTMLVDPSGISEPVQAAATQPAATTTVPVATRAPAPVTNTRRSAVTEPVTGGTRYQVRPGETLSEIAQRIQDRPVGLWPAVFAIFDANPDAFLDGDPNRIKAGSWLTIPDFGAGAPLTVASASSADSAAPARTTNQPATSETANSSVYTGMTPDQAAVPLNPVALAPEELAAEEVAPQDVTPQQQIVQEPPISESTEIASAPVIDIPDTELDAPVAASASPNVATARVQRAPAPESGTNWMLWLGGAGLALIGLMLFFGRQVRNRFGASPIAEAVPQNRRESDNSRTLEVVSEMEVSVSDLDETEENLALDADLIIGSGLQESSDVDIAQDFSFAATTELDHEFTDEMIAGEHEQVGETDIIPPLNIEAQSILESEVLPDEPVQSDEDDDYDMSVIVDATQMPDPEDATVRDLEAIPVNTDDDTLVAGDYTVSSEVDYTVLEQDYEDELTATQALNEEIARAAQKLADDMEEEGSDVSRASITALDITAQLPANNDEEFGDGDEDDDTAKLPANRGV